jgi:Bacterial lectin/GEVED domain/Secretion system C-terminal sorting domain/N-terminal domain of BNR-repeat neuraminidase
MNKKSIIIFLVFFLSISSYAQYCVCEPQNATDEAIFNVTIGTLNNTSTCSTTGGSGSALNKYSDYTGLTPTVLSQGVNYTFSVDIGLCSPAGTYSNCIAIYIDYNQDQDFDDLGETVYESSATTTGAHTENGSITIPVTANLGNTRMRVVSLEGPTTNLKNCYNNNFNYKYGETEDYTVTIGPPPAMYFTSCTSNHQNVDNVSMGSSRQEVIQLEVIVSGALNPINVTEIKLRTDGTTDIADITNACIWYTGGNNSFTPINQFGGIVSNPPLAGTTMSFLGTQTLQPGSNYFWLSYDILTTSTPGNVIDAFFESIIVDGNTEIPVQSNPSGNRTIMDGCYHTLHLYNNGFNGWDGAKITVNVNGVSVITDATIWPSGDYKSYEFIAKTGDNITALITDPGTNPTENRYMITNCNGAFILMSGVDIYSPQNTFNVTTNCESYPQFTVNGDSYMTAVNGFLMTEDRTSQSGTVWCNYKIDLSQDFQIDLSANFGFSDAGADGMYFVLQNQCTSTGGSGGSIGFGGIRPSLGVEFDTYCNGIYNDPTSDHVAIMKNGYLNHANPLSNLAGPVTISNLENGGWKNISILWTASTTSLEVEINASNVISYTGDIVNDIFGGEPYVFWGFTGGTGANHNRQWIYVDSFPVNSGALPDIYCNPCNEQVSVSTGAGSYTWSPNDGSIDDPTIYNPTFTPTVTTEYTVLIEDACGNLITNVFTIYVENPLPIELLSFTGESLSKDINQLFWTTASETNNDYFIVEYSNNGINFSNVGNIKGAGTSSTTRNYQITHKNNYMEEISYYRLKQVDFDGKSETSDIIVVKQKSNDTEITIYPNPFMDEITIEFSNRGEGSYLCEITNCIGELIIIKELKAGNNKYNINFDQSIPAGTYFIRVSNEDECIIQKIIKY